MANEEVKAKSTEETKAADEANAQAQEVADETKAQEAADAATEGATEAQAEEAVTEETVKADVAAVETALKEAENRYVRLQADFDNFKRRTNQEKDQLASFVKADVMKDLFPVLDNFERALSAPATDETKAFLDGFVMIHQNLMDMLSKHGLATIEAVGKPFDPNFHQAIMRVESDEYDDDTVCEVLQTGYTVDGKTVRPAMVKVVHNG